ncbi:MAG: DeoR/GlpR family DNA-binding transcription regulator [Bacillota bacterium]|nr:DeoR/GlpR family DNA-binding transcription regulator [Bacillota bacterium]
MLKERREQINSIIQSRGEIRLAELAELFPQVSTMTLRRDLEALEQDGELIRTRGGAASLHRLSLLKEAAYRQRQLENTEAKLAIAQKASALIRPGTSLYVDSGTTCMIFAHALDVPNLVVLTPAPNIAIELAAKPGIRVHLTGGQLNPDTLTLSGSPADEYVDALNVDTAVMAASAFSLTSGFSCGDHQEARLKRRVIQKARRVIVLMDSSKLDSQLPFTFARFEDIDVLVSEGPLPRELRKQAEAAGVTLP